MIKPTFIFLTLLFANQLFASMYLFIHRSESEFETKGIMEVTINFVPVLDLSPGEWQVLEIDAIPSSLVLNARLKQGSGFTTEESCALPSKKIETAENKVAFVFLSEEYCSIRLHSRERSLEKIMGANINSGKRLNGRRSTLIPEDELKALVKELVGKLASVEGDVLPTNIDSLRLLAMEALELRKKLAQKEVEMRNQLLEYFELMKALNQLDEHVQPVIYLNMEQGGLKSNGEMRYDIRATFSYDIIEDGGVKAELIHYPSGAYQLDRSAAAQATAFSLRKSVTNYLTEYFEPGSIVKIRIIGSADASPIKSPIPYLGEYHSIEGHAYEIVKDYQIRKSDTNLLSFNETLERSGSELMREVAPKPVQFPEGIKESLSMSTSDTFTSNEHLAYLRSLGIREYMLENVKAMSRTRNKFLHQVKLEEGIGGMYRKVVMELLIEDVVRKK